MNGATKQCSSCKEEKPLGDFWAQRKQCKMCKGARYAEWYAKHREERKVASATRYREHRDEVRAYAAKRYAGNREELSHRMLAARYGLTSAQWDALYAEQGGRCAACGQHCPSRGRYALHTDHDHNTGKVRALLCQGCNVAEGCLEGDPQRAIQLAAYMQSFKDEIPQ